MTVLHTFNPSFAFLQLFFKMIDYYLSERTSRHGLSFLRKKAFYPRPKDLIGSKCVLFLLVGI